MNALEHDLKETIWRSRGERRQSLRADFTAGWQRYWRTFGLPWMAVVGFSAAMIVARLVADVVWWTLRALL